MEGQAQGAGPTNGEFGFAPQLEEIQLKAHLHPGCTRAHHLNHFALKAKLYLAANRAAFQQLQLIKAQPNA